MLPRKWEATQPRIPEITAIPFTLHKGQESAQTVMSTDAKLLDQTLRKGIDGIGV